MKNQAVVFIVLMSVSLTASTLPIRHSESVTSIQKKIAKISGTVSDPLGAVVRGARVSAKSTSFAREAVTDAAGQYELQLPADTYVIEVWSPGFCRARRAAFRFEGQTDVKFVFQLLVCASHGPRPTNFETLELGRATPEPRDVLIEFGKRAQILNGIQYDGTVSEINYYDRDTNQTQRLQSYVRVTATHNCWTVSARRMVLDEKSLRLLAQGDVLIVDGHRETKASNAEIDFSLTNPIVNVRQ